MTRLTYEIRPEAGKWHVRLEALTLFSFDTRAEAIARADDLAVVGAKGRDVEIVVYDEAGAVVSRTSALDYEI